MLPDHFKLDVQPSATIEVARTRYRFHDRAGAGDVSVVPPQRTYQLIFHRVAQPEQTTVTVNSVPSDGISLYDKELQRFTLEVVTAPTKQVEVAVRYEGKSWQAQDDRREQRLQQMLRAFRMESDSKRWIDQYRAEIFEDPDRLKEFGAAVKDAHIEALRSVIDSREL